MPKASKVTMLPPTIDLQTKAAIAAPRKKRVAAYARVSTVLEEQQSSYAAQGDYYTNLIKNNSAWEYVNLYADEGISATSTKKRDGFNRMIKDALDGKIDLILTKSVSRFARNTVDSLTVIRQLKEKGVFVIFEKENIDTSDAKGELLITIMSSLAQEESRSISENVIWGKRKAMADGKVFMCYGNFLGYEKGEDGTPRIVESEAKIVRLIYKMYLNGKSANAIAQHLTTKKVLTPRGYKNWSARTIISILGNEKYCGCNISQKTYCESFLTHKMLKNHGELPQFFVEDSHPAIISRETFDLVQDEVRRNSETGVGRNTTHIFSGRVICGVCGHFYGKKVWSSNTKYRKIVWRCNAKYQRADGISRGAQCKSPHLTEQQLEYAFITAFNEILSGKDYYFAEYETIVAEITDTAALDAERDKLNAESVETYELIKAAMDENARKALNQDEYEHRFAELATKYDRQKTQLAELTEQRQSVLVRRERLNLFLAELAKRDEVLTDFDEPLFVATVEKMTVNSESNVVVLFRDGTEINVDVTKS
ncbi:serine recombinase [Clostridia bacterium]|nr:serine recombinase [Clostridia bacterium]